jgi:RNA polymerase-binding transcription factor DksA
MLDKNRTGESAVVPFSERKTQLETRLRDLRARVASIEAQLDSEHDPDWEDLATQREGDETLEGLGNSAQQEMRQIDAALTRIANGTYGVCVTCGDPISDRRLDLLPCTPFCQNCAH